MGPGQAGETGGDVALVAATDASAFGAKAANLARASVAGLSVPDGVALSWSLVDSVADGHQDAAVAVATRCRRLQAPLVVRSSGVGEDSAAASFAGQHLSVLNVGADGVVDAVGAVWHSARTEAALSYRRRLGLPSPPRMGVVVQCLVDADVAGVAFDANPVTGADEVVVEAAWGLGQSVVAGTVAPDFFRMSPTGQVFERRPGHKEVELRPAPDGGTVDIPLPAEKALAPALDDNDLSRLARLVLRCRSVFGGSQDLEWALADGTLWLLQRRPRTAVA
ncbi:MAG: PEP/pyruvate-binding domain-containing protein [Acidimicrobiales bacterium]